MRHKSPVTCRLTTSRCPELGQQFILRPRHMSQPTSGYRMRIKGLTLCIHERLPFASVSRWSPSMTGADIHPASPVDDGAHRWVIREAWPQQMIGLEGLCRSQGFHAPGPSGRFISPFACTMYRRASGCGTAILILCQKRSDDQRVLVRHRHDGPFRAATRSQLIHPSTEPVRLADSRS